MMNENNRVTITICGKEYTLQTDESPDYVRQLAARLDRRISDMMETSDIISLSSAAILVGLSLMDDSYKTTSNIDNIRGEIRNNINIEPLDGGKELEIYAEKVFDHVVDVGGDEGIGTGSEQSAQHAAQKVGKTDGHGKTLRAVRCRFKTGRT